MPPAVTATGRIARAAARVEARPFPLRWLKTTRLFFREITAAASPAVKPVLANLWLTGGLVKLIMARNPSSAALLHTTAAPTIIRGSSKENVLAEDAMAVINVRILPGESVAGTVSRIKKVVGDDKVEVSLLDEEAATEPVKESSVKSEGYRLISEMIEETIADSVVLPFLVTVATDSKYYAGCCRDIYRYVPMILNREELERIHGADERISAENYGLAVNSYKNLIKKL
jgi:carboxypeptidase PM20D1